MPNEVKTLLPNWKKLHRLVPSHFPPIDLFENVANPEDLEIVWALESLTNDRLKEQAGDLALVPVAERICAFRIFSCYGRFYSHIFSN